MPQGGHACGHPGVWRCPPSGADEVRRQDVVEVADPDRGPEAVDLATVVDDRRAVRGGQVEQVVADRGEGEAGEGEVGGHGHLPELALGDGDRDAGGTDVRGDLDRPVAQQTDAHAGRVVGVPAAVSGDDGGPDGLGHGVSSKLLDQRRGCVTWGIQQTLY